MTEYRVIERRWEYRDSESFRVDKAERMGVELTQLASEGWELVSLAPNGGGYLCALKRTT